MQEIKLAKKTAKGYVIPVGSWNLVFASTGKGMVSCGAIDVIVLDKFDYPAARVKSSTGGKIETIDDLLSGTIKDANAAAKKRGIVEGMSGKEALEKL
ncbi:MAG: YunC family protein [Candidatus Margulisiibacteriota bacterium]